MSEKFDNETRDLIADKAYNIGISGSIGGDTMPKKFKQKLAQNIIIPIEDYAGMPTPSQMQAIKQYALEQFPEMFVDKQHRDDVETNVLGLKANMSAKLYAALLEAKISYDLKAAKTKKRN